MNPDEYERLKEAEKAHLRKVRALKQQLREAQRTERLSEALRGMDTSDLGDEFDEALRAVQQKNLTSEARFEMAMEALDAEERRERQRLELEAFEEEQRKRAAADLIRQMKEDMTLGEHAPERVSSQATHGASAIEDEPEAGRGEPPTDEPPPGKSIGRRPAGSD